ncbi:MAG: M20/M25/M40 family metallo-hydrolase [Acidimicrobiia bacterium]|nr:MAG: M20/M25/M40 family metallo-hydrolase [Acidimicrobiia bacterium]
MNDAPDAIEAVSLLVDMIMNACVNTGDPDSGNEIRSVRTIQDFLGETGTVVEPMPTRASVIYRIVGTDRTAPKLLMIPHLDVVPANAADWSHDPFGAVRQNGFVWGRGAVDMLNVTAAMVVVYRWLRDGVVAPPAGDVILACVADEEAGGVHGAKYLVENRWDLVACDYVLTEVAGPTLGNAPDASLPVTIAEKGPFWRSVTAKGTAGHGSQPYGRSNAVLTLAEAFSRIGATQQPVSITDAWVRFVPHLDLDETTAGMLIDSDTVDAAIHLVAETDPTLARWIHACTHMTLSPNVLSGGTKVNMIPDDAMGDLDIRLLPGQDQTDVDDHLRKVLGPELFDEIEFSPILDMRANSSPADGPLWEAIADAAETHLGTRKLAPTLTPVTTDARFFRERGIPAYGVGLFDDSVTFPEMLAMFHGVDEKVSERSVMDTTRFLASVVSAFSERVSFTA